MNKYENMSISTALNEALNESLKLNEDIEDHELYEELYNSVYNSVNNCVQNIFANIKKEVPEYNMDWLPKYFDIEKPLNNTGAMRQIYNYMDNLVECILRALLENAK